METNLVICGSGGQGVLLSGTVLCHAGLKEGKNVTWLPSYGAEKRGGLSYCCVVLSDKNIASPVIGKAEVIIALDNVGFDNYENSLSENGLLILNSSLIKRETKRKDAKVCKFPITELAKELGNIRIANMLALGIYVGKTKAVKLRSIIAALDNVASEKYKELVAINKKAMEKGFQLGNSR
ncbi:MAG: 2-oxoacid:acceptor oxidoreductase family protein [Candidatus Firestonebacteria bacterium]|nr:2-oxoacid:acceptor oxidoreductase family protein [Candidatus Firestonebacteria bacterium]